MIGEKLAVIEFHVARSGFGVAEGICFATASSFPEGDLRSGAPALADFNLNQNKQAKDAKDNPNYTLGTNACVVL